MTTPDTARSATNAKDYVPREDDFPDDDGDHCSWCGGEAVQECDDPIQCCDPDCDGQIGPCRACNGSGMARDQVVW